MPIFLTTSTQKSEFVPAFKKMDLFHQFIVKIQLILEFCKSGHTHFRPSLPKAFSINFYFHNLYRHAQIQAISLICSENMTDA